MNNGSFNEGLTDKEREFCCNYINTGNIKESAIKAGYVKGPEKIGAKMLYKKEISSEIERLYEEKQKNLMYKACSGYERLAFGNIADAVRLLYLEDPNDVNLEKMDLFNISEIKKIKGGGVEIKFFDRLKALEKLESAKVYNSKEENSFYSALEHTASLLENKDL